MESQWTSIWKCGVMTFRSHLRKNAQITFWFAQMKSWVRNCTTLLYNFHYSNNAFFVSLLGFEWKSCTIVLLWSSAIRQRCAIVQLNVAQLCYVAQFTLCADWPTSAPQSTTLVISKLFHHLKPFKWFWCQGSFSTALLGWHQRSLM